MQCAVFHIIVFLASFIRFLVCSVHFAIEIFEIFMLFSYMQIISSLCLSIRRLGAFVLAFFKYLRSEFGRILPETQDFLILILLRKTSPSIHKYHWFYRSGVFLMSQITGLVLLFNHVLRFWDCPGKIHVTHWSTDERGHLLFLISYFSAQLTTLTLFRESRL